LKIDEYHRIRSRITNCELCKLCLNRTNAVPGAGNINSDIIFVGEAPGRDEDKIGLPFVGMAGRILNEALRAAGIERDEIYITNSVKCRPPNNRIPEYEEISKCKIYLDDEIRLIVPKIICILGATAMQTILNIKGIHSNRGKTIIKNNNRYFITYHPAATIYNNKLKEVFFRDITKLSAISKTTNQNLDIQNKI
jgi:DNA polymerase